MSTDLQQQVREKGRAAAVSVAAAVLLTAAKLFVGLATGSLGIMAEAAHSGLDFGAAVITFFAVRVSDRPPDEAHPYGHGKVENLSALAETLLLLVTCGWIIYEAVDRLLGGAAEIDPSVWAFLTMGASIVVDYSRSRVLARAARKYNSQALEADALHFGTDIWSSAVVIAGLALVWLGDALGRKALLARADAVAALLVALIVVRVSVRLGRRAVDALIDRAPSGLAEEIARAVEGLESVRRVLRTRVRGAGAQLFVDVRVAVPRRLSFEESHGVTQQVQDAVRAVASSADVVVHTVPVAEGEGVLERIQAAAARGHFNVHHVTAHLTQRGLWIDLDLEVPPELSFEEAHARATDVEQRLRAEFDGVDDAPAGGRGVDAGAVADINVHIEPRSQDLIPGLEMPPAEQAIYIERIQSICAATPHARACRDIDVQRLARGVHVAFHVLVDADLSTAQVHGIADDMERRLRGEFPQLARVMIHTEPHRRPTS